MNRDFKTYPPQDYENRDFLLYGVAKADSLKSIADYVLAAQKHLGDLVYEDQIWEKALQRAQSLLNIPSEKDAEKILQQELEKLNKEKYESNH